MSRRIHRHAHNKRKQTNNSETNRPQSKIVALSDIETNRPQNKNVASSDAETDRPQNKNVASSDAETDRPQNKNVASGDIGTKKSKVKSKFPKTRLTLEEYERLQRLRRICGEESDSDFIRKSIQIRMSYLNKLKEQFGTKAKISEMSYNPEYSGNYDAELLDPIINSLQKALTSTRDLEESSEKDFYKMVINFLIMHLKNSQNDNLQYK